MKKWLMLLLVSLLFVMAACGNTDKEDEGTTESPENGETENADNGEKETTSVTIEDVYGEKNY